MVPPARYHIVEQCPDMLLTRQHCTLGPYPHLHALLATNEPGRAGDRRAAAIPVGKGP